MKPHDLILIVLLISYITACSDSEWYMQNVNTHPAWYASTSHITLTTDDDVSTLWQSKKRCCIAQDRLDKNNREFYKSCVQAINTSRSDETLVVRCLWLMDIAVDKPRKIKIKEYLVHHYFDHQARTDNCANCMTGDIIARVSKELAYYYSLSDPEHAIATMENVLDRRQKEISHWVLAEMYTFLGNLYIKSGYAEQRKVRFNGAYEYLSQFRHHETLRKRMRELDKVYKKINPHQFD